ncbi:MAG: hypothetical protein WCY11_04785 [Novosphingobium sp.]
MMSVSAARLRQGTTICGISIAWVAAFELNGWVFSALEHTIRAHWIFLPAALRLLAILMFGRIGAAGLVLGAYLTVQGTAGGDAVHEILLSLCSGITPLVAVGLGKWMLDVPGNLAGLRSMHIVVLCALCASLNALVLNAYLLASGRPESSLVQILTIFVGDLLGAAIVLLLLAGILALILPRTGRTPTMKPMQ